MRFGTTLFRQKFGNEVRQLDQRREPPEKLLEILKLSTATTNVFVVLIIPWFQVRVLAGPPTFSIT